MWIAQDSSRQFYSFWIDVVQVRVWHICVYNIIIWINRYIWYIHLWCIQMCTPEIPHEAVELRRRPHSPCSSSSMHKSHRSSSLPPELPGPLSPRPLSLSNASQAPFPQHRSHHIQAVQVSLGPHRIQSFMRIFVFKSWENCENHVKIMWTCCASDCFRTAGPSTWCFRTALHLQRLEQPSPSSQWQYRPCHASSSPCGSSESRREKRENA